VNDWTAFLHEPVFALSGAKLDELELLVGGLYAPADGYCLPGEKSFGWPRELKLAVPSPLAGRAIASGGLLLSDPEGTPLARLALRRHDRGLGRFASDESGVVHVAGTLEPLQPAEHPPARELRLTAPLPERGGPYLVAAFVAPPRASQIAQALAAAHAGECRLMLMAFAGSSAANGRSVRLLLASLQECAAQVPNALVRLVVIPDVDKGARVSRAVLANLGAAVVLDFTEERTEELRLADIPHTPAVLPEVRHEGLVVLFTGLSGSGKSTLARRLAEELQSIDDRAVILLDGDEMRRVLSAGLGFSSTDRELNVRRVGWVAAQISRAGGTAVCAPIAPFEATRRECAAMAREWGGYFLVHVATPLRICEERDRKGLYAKARAGLIPEFTGISSPYETPQDADYVVDTSQLDLDTAVREITQLVRTREVPATSRLS
jgi:sulfate adenylyltransferase